jgi:hypothetical protein
MIAPVLDEREQRTDYRMLESIDIKNFRCFENTSLRELKRINIITGRNASGKTALLEAIYMTLGAPALSLKLRTWRGLSNLFQVSEQTETLNAIWRDYFYRFDQSHPASIAFKGSQDLSRSLVIRCDTETGVRLSQGKDAGKDELDIKPLGPISFDWYKASRRIGVAKPEFDGETLKIKGGPDPLPGAFFSSTQTINQQEAANWFSDLSKRRDEQPIIEALQHLFPFIKGLSVETQGTQPMLHADIPSLPEKIPVSLISSGINRLVAMLVAIATQRHGILIVDEIENGFHFESMPGIWKVLYDLCKRSQVQLFASTHSGECLEALESVMIGHEDDFTLIRTERENGKCVARHFGGLNFRRALEQDIEVR